MKRHSAADFPRFSGFNELVYHRRPAIEDIELGYRLFYNGCNHSGSKLWSSNTSKNGLLGLAGRPTSWIAAFPGQS
jgi:hypothetical protein